MFAGLWKRQWFVIKVKNMFREWFNLYAPHAVFVGGLIELVEAELDGVRLLLREII
jgi:hypothetical protein